MDLWLRGEANSGRDVEPTVLDDVPRSSWTKLLMRMYI